MLPRQYINERKRQIDTLKIFNANVTELQENMEYQVEFQAGKQCVQLKVILTLDFPTEKPAIFISPHIVHPWVDENSQVVSAPGLINFSSHSDLGRVVQVIVREFQNSLPLQIEQATENSEFSSPTNGSMSHSNSLTPDLSPQDTTPRAPLMSPTSGLTSPVSAILFPQLNDMTNDELAELLENSDLQVEFINSIIQAESLSEQLAQLVTNIETSARYNMEKQQEMTDLKTDIINKMTDVMKLKSKYEDLIKKHQQLSEAYEAHNIGQGLLESAAKADEEAEVIADQFLAGEIDADTFVSSYCEKRSLGQSRRAKHERLSHQLSLLDKAKGVRR